MKSTIIDAISFGLFGKAFRGIKKPSLINSINQRDSVIEISFKIGQDNYNILRGQKPHRFEVYKNDNQLNETAAISDMQKHIEMQILGFDFATFGRVIVMSSMNYTPFLLLSANERRQFVETMLGLSVFTEMNKQHKTNLSKIKDKSILLTAEISKLESQLKDKTEFLQYIKNNLNAELLESRTQLETLLFDIEKLGKELKDFDTKLAQYDNIDKLDSEISDIYKSLQEVKEKESVLKYTLKEQSKNKSFLENNNICNHCLQDITEDYKESMIDKIEQSENDITTSLSSILSELSKINSTFENKNSELKKLESEKNKLDSEKNTKQILRKRLISDSKQIVSKIENLKIKSSSNTDDIITELSEIENKLKDARNEFEELKEIAFASSIVSDLLKDSGIKADIIKQYIPLLCAYANQYLEKMNVAIKIDIDENFNETIITRFANEYSYNNLSAGERVRVDLSLAFSWSRLAKTKNSVHTNLLILDETLDANLDESGTLAAMDIINDLSNEGVHIFIVSHKANMSENVRSVLTLDKVNGFTEIV